jgi:hypothetical protein
MSIGGGNYRADNSNSNQQFADRMGIDEPGSSGTY